MTSTTTSCSTGGAAFCTQLEATGRALEAVFNLQVAKQTAPGDVSAARRPPPALPNADEAPKP